ncbi:MAG TPA: hypothetical protein PKO22_02315 [Treponemataceae bacterium]|nr:hypothetical protein [Treponemataceae bacterium]
MKKFLSLILALVVCAAAFAQASGGNKSVKKYLAPSDVDALVKNFKPIGEELDALGDMESMVGLDVFMSPDFDSLNFLASIKSSPQLDAVFVKHGMGKDGFRKLYVIIWAFEVAAFDRVIAAYDDTEGAMALSGMQPAMESLRSCINPADYELVSSRWDDLTLIFGDPTAEETADESTGEELEEVMTVDDFYGDDSSIYDDSDYDYDEDAEYDD